MILWLLSIIAPVTADEPATDEFGPREPPLSEDTGRADVAPAIETINVPRWRFGAGGLLRSVKTHSIRSGSYSQDYPLPNLSDDKVRRYDSGGDLQTVTDRHYNNGYVLQDEWTDLDGSTWNDGPPSLLQEWRNSRSDAETAFGYFTQLELGLRLTQWLDLALFGRYDWIENISLDVGQARYLVNPEGGSLGGTVNLRF